MSWRDVPGDDDDAPGFHDATDSESNDDAVADPTGARLAVTLENLDAACEMLRAQPPTELEIDFEGYICLDEYNAKYAEKLERPRVEAAGAASEAWVLGDSLARLRDAMLPRLTRVSLAGADRLPVAMLRVAFPLDGDGLAAPAPYDDGSGSLLSIDFAPGSPARDGIESYDSGDPFHVGRGPQRPGGINRPREVPPPLEFLPRCRARPHGRHKGLPQEMV